MFRVLRGRAPRALIVLAGLLLAATEAPAFIINQYPDKTVVELFHAGLGHYLILSNPQEIAAVAAPGTGWVRTGYSFAARNESQYAPNVCRFNAPAVGSHFYTGFAYECDALRTHDLGWVYEGNDFSIPLPDAVGQCVGAQVPIHRFYDNRPGDPNHRYVADLSERNRMAREGWIDEGVVFCALAADRVPVKAFAFGAGVSSTSGTSTTVLASIRPRAECEDEALNLGSCVGLEQVPALANEIVSWLPPFYVTLGPDYSDAFTALTGFNGNVYTAQDPHDASAVAAHSFVQTLGIGTSIVGARLVSTDRVAGDLASITPIYRLPTRAPAASAFDGRVFPWRFPNRAELDLSFGLEVNRLARATPESQAYGHATLVFHDARGGQDFRVTLQAYGSGVAGDPGDFVMRDATTGRVIVSTGFRAAPAFGTRLAGDFMHCDDVAHPGTCDRPGENRYAFRIDRAAFADILGRARMADAALSADPSDYALASFQFKNEVYRAAELGGHVQDLRVEIFGY